MLSIDDARAGEYRQAFHNAAHRFWRMHLGESFLVSSTGIGPEGFRVGVRRFGEEQESPLVVRIGEDPEAAILTALEEWWADRSQT